jgi:hypothetical protein
MAAAPVIFNRRRIYQSASKNIGLGENAKKPPGVI